MKKSIHIEETRIIDHSMERVWPIVSDTNRLNRSIGLFPVTFSPFAKKSHRLVRKAEGTAYGLLHIEWVENIFEWMRESYYSVERNYTKGPVDRVRWKVSVEKANGNQTAVTLSGQFDYHSIIGKLALKKGIIPQLLKTFDYIEEACSTSSSVQKTTKQTAVQVDAQSLQNARSYLKELSIEPDLIHALMSTIEEESDEAVTHMQPYRWAYEHGFTKQQAVHLFLIASDAGVLDYEWSLMCPNCRVAKDHAAALKDVKQTVHCDLCGIDFKLDFDKYIELTFQVNQAIRKVKKETFCVNGPAQSSHTIGQFRVPAHSEIIVPWLPVLADLQVRVLKHNFIVPLVYQTKASASSLHIQQTGIEEQVLFQSENISIVNESDEEYAVTIEETQWDRFALTARDVTSLQLFRELLPAEVLAPGMQIGVGKLTVLFTDLKNSTQLYERVGDARAYSDVQKHFVALGSIIRTYDGTIVKTIGDSIMAVFSTSDNALQAAIAIQSSISTLNETLDSPLTIKIGFQEGSVIAVNANDILDYFGRTVNMAARIQQESKGGDIVLEKKLFEHMRIKTKLGSTEEFTTRLYGVEEPIQLVRLIPEFKKS